MLDKKIRIGMFLSKMLRQVCVKGKEADAFHGKLHCLHLKYI